jgi:hypothetical protein
MFTGWQPVLSIDRGLYPTELKNRLERTGRRVVSPDDAIAMTRFNSTYLEMVDRTFKIKGMFAPLAGISALAAFLVASLSLPWRPLVVESEIDLENIAAVAWMSQVFVGCCVRLWRINLRKDLFQYTYYPVRFNRRSQKVYFFRHNGAEGVVEVPWDSPALFFHVGCGGQNTELRDLRCHVLDENRQVMDTFTMGHFWAGDAEVHKMWEFICRYMQNGADQAFATPSEGVITLSTLPTLRNHWMMVCLMMGTALLPMRYTLMFPLYAALTACRWLVFKSCTAPVFPQKIELECAISVDDPLALPEPRFMAEFARAHAVRQHVRERLWEWNAHEGAMLFDASWVGWKVVAWILAGLLFMHGLKDFALANLYGACLISTGFLLVFATFLSSIGGRVGPHPRFE